MDELRRIRDVFRQYRSLSNSNGTLLLGGLFLVGSVFDVASKRTIATGDPLPVILVLVMIGLLGVIIWALRSPPGQVIDLQWSTSQTGPLTGGSCLAVIAFGVLLALIALFAGRSSIDPWLYLAATFLASGIFTHLSYRTYRNLTASALIGLAILLPALAASISQSQLLSQAVAWRLSFALGMLGASGMGVVVLREGLRPPTARRAARLLADERAPQGLGNPDALPVLAALCGCAGASPLLLQRLSRGPVDDALADLSGAGLAVVEPGAPDPRNSIARSTAAGRQALAALIG